MFLQNKFIYITYPTYFIIYTFEQIIWEFDGGETTGMIRMSEEDTTAMEQLYQQRGMLCTMSFLSMLSLKII